MDAVVVVVDVMMRILSVRCQQASLQGRKSQLESEASISVFVIVQGPECYVAAFDGLTAKVPAT